MSSKAIKQVHMLLSGSQPEPVSKSVEDFNKVSRSAMFSKGEDIKQVNCEIVHNAPIGVYVEEALRSEAGSMLTNTGALSVKSGAKTGRSPKDKRVVREPSSENNVWWGPVNIPLEENAFMINRERAVDYLNTRKRLFVFDGFAGWDHEHRIAVRVVTERAYHALFMHTMLVRPTAEELANFEPDFTILNAGCFPANRYVQGMTSSCSVDLHLARGEMIILGTQYAGEMKKGVLTVMMYHMPLKGILPLHSSANEGPDGGVTLFFGLSGTGKTTLSADARRSLIGDDEHVWTDKGVFNIEGGCYAKCANLSAEKEPEIFGAIKFGAVIENVIINENTRAVDYDDISLTENTRCAYPLESIPNAKLPALGNQPKNVVLLTCDGFGVLPPISRLSREQVIYHFLNGYTSKMAGTEVGVTEAVAAFSSCYGEPFLVWHPLKYAEMLADRLERQGADAWLLNTGWLGGTKHGQRCPLKYSRAIIDAIHSGELRNAEYKLCPMVNLSYPTTCTGVPAAILDPASSWKDAKEFAETTRHLSKLCRDNFAAKYAASASPEVLAAGPTDPALS